MEETLYTVTLSDGTVLDNLTLNGNNFISQLPVSPDIFEGNCSPVVISNGEVSEEHANMELIQAIKDKDGYSFILCDIPETELQHIKDRSDIDYIAMMSGIEL